MSFKSTKERYIKQYLHKQRTKFFEFMKTTGDDQNKKENPITFEILSQLIIEENLLSSDKSIYN